jgi:beta-mannosidase
VGGHYYLEFQGLDTVCSITLNGREIGSTDNQFVKYIFSVAVIAGKNTLELYFKDPVKWALQKSRDYPYPVPDGYAVEQNGEKNRNFIRKEQCSFSWDWGPCCLPIGVWKDLRLINISKSVYVTDWTVDIWSQDASFIVDVNFWTIMHGIESYCISAEISELDQSWNVTCERDQAHLRLVIPKGKVSLWYPNGYGEQKLYTLSVVLKENSFDQINVCAKLSKKIGFRTAELKQEKYDDGRPGASFFFCVNNVDIFAKGTNWIPADAFESRVSEASIR